MGRFFILFFFSSPYYIWKFFSVFFHRFITDFPFFSNILSPMGDFFNRFITDGKTFFNFFSSCFHLWANFSTIFHQYFIIIIIYIKRIVAKTYMSNRPASPNGPILIIFFLLGVYSRLDVSSSKKKIGGRRGPWKFKFYAIFKSFLNLL